MICEPETVEPPASAAADEAAAGPGTAAGAATPSTPAVELRLIEGLPIRRLERELLRANRHSGIGNRALAFYLDDMQERGLHQALGFVSAVHFAQRRLELSRWHARDLLAAGRALSELRLIDAAFGKGQITWTKTRTLARIAEPETESEWLKKALELTFEQLDRLVARSEKGRPPREDGKGLPEVKFTIKAKLDPIDHETIEQARRKLSAQAGAELSLSEGLAAMARLTLRSDAAPSDGTGTEGVGGLFRIVLDRCRDCGHASVRTADGPIDIDPAKAAMIACEAPSYEVRAADTEAGMGASSTLRSTQEPTTGATEGMDQGGAAAPPPADSRQLAHGLDRPTPPWLREKILARDGYRCVCCGRQKDLMAHHLVFRSRGGRTTAENMSALCSSCHAMVHEGLIRITGSAPHGLQFFDREGRPLDRPVRREPDGLTVLRVEGGDGGSAIAAVAAPKTDTDGGAAAPPVAPAEAKVEARPAAVTFETLPREADMSWWRSHAHLFDWLERRGVLSFSAGHAVLVQEVQNTTAGGAAAPPQSAAERPSSLGAIVGQKQVVELLEDAVAAAKKEARPVHHVLLNGPPGLGKTTLGRAVAAEMGTRPWITSGPALKDLSTLVGLLTRLGDRDVLFIDEVHSLGAGIPEMLYEAMEDRTLSLPVTDGVKATTLTLKLSPFTLIGATTNPEKLTQPLQSRFKIVAELDHYSEKDLAEIVLRAAGKNGVVLEQGGAEAVASAALGTPRNALRHWTRISDWAVARARHLVGAEEAREALKLAGIDSQGLGPVHRKALGILKRAGGKRAIGTARLAWRLGLSRRTFHEIYERDLVRLDLVAATPRGLAAVS